MRVASHKVPDNWYVICPCCERRINLIDVDVMIPEPEPVPLKAVAERYPTPEGPEYPLQAYLDAKPFLDTLYGFRRKVPCREVSRLRKLALAGDIEGAKDELKRLTEEKQGGCRP